MTSPKRKKYKHNIRRLPSSLSPQERIKEASDPRASRRALVRKAIRREIEPNAWKRCAVVEKAERESLRHVLDNWKGVDGGAP